MTTVAPLRRSTVTQSQFPRYLQLTARRIDEIFIAAYGGEIHQANAAYINHQRHGVVPEIVERYVERELERMERRDG